MSNSKISQQSRIRLFFQDSYISIKSQNNVTRRYYQITLVHYKQFSTIKLLFIIKCDQIWRLYILYVKIIAICISPHKNSSDPIINLVNSIVLLLKNVRNDICSVRHLPLIDSLWNTLMTYSLILVLVSKQGSRFLEKEFYHSVYPVSQKNWATKRWAWQRRKKALKEK